jgi:probable phosphoglycerate mutase
VALDHPLIVVRHGETDWNADGRLQGQRDIPLNGRGRDQARGVGRLLAGALPDFDAHDFVSSPLSRCRETMELMRGAIGRDPRAYRLDDRLLELTFGRWEGLTWEELRGRDPEGAAAREADKWGYVPPGGENYAMLTARVAGWLAEIRGPTVTVTHGGVARVLLGLLGGVAEVDLPLREITQGRALVFDKGAATWI